MYYLSSLVCKKPLKEDVKKRQNEDLLPVFIGLKKRLNPETTSIYHLDVKMIWQVLKYQIVDLKKW